jgi:hypothetical protein
MMNIKCGFKERQQSVINEREIYREFQSISSSRFLNIKCGFKERTIIMNEREIYREFKV